MNRREFFRRSAATVIGTTIGGAAVQGFAEVKGGSGSDMILIRTEKGLFWFDGDRAEPVDQEWQKKCMDLAGNGWKSWHAKAGTI